MLIADFMFPVIQSQISLESGDKTIRVDCFLPDDHGQRFPAVIGLHGSGGGHSSMAEPASSLAARGFAVYVLHYFDRTGTVEVNREIIFRHFPIWMKTLWDSVSFVSRQPHVDPERIGLLGFSLGAYLALSNAAIDARIRVVVDFFGGLPKEMKFFMRRLCPVLILHGEADKMVPVEEAYHLQKVLEKKGIAYEMQIYPGEAHHFTPEVRANADSRMHAFLQKYLAQPASSDQAES